MLYKFKSKASGDVIMFETHAKALLEIMGKDPSAKGILLVADMPKALEALEVALKKHGHEANHEAEHEADHEADHEVSHEKGHASPAKHRSKEQEHEQESLAVSLGQRAAPMRQMIKQCILEGHPIVWGV
ncbi:MAG: DUF1840 domain-containing protein [Betaproteobacteria bacterium]|jgi:hypothetical protein